MFSQLPHISKAMEMAFHCLTFEYLSEDVQACRRVIAVNKQQKIHPETKVELIVLLHSGEVTEVNIGDR